MCARELGVYNTHYLLPRHREESARVGIDGIDGADGGIQLINIAVDSMGPALLDEELAKF